MMSRKREHKQFGMGEEIHVISIPQREGLNSNAAERRDCSETERLKDRNYKFSSYLSISVIVSLNP